MQTARSTQATRIARGFTLIEILIVVIILGILAAIVIPQFTSASQDARKSSLVSMLQGLRSQIQLYKLQHGDELPDLTNATNPWAPLMTTSTYNGKTFGPYMQTTPVNPLNQLSAVVNGNGTAAAGSDCGFIYDYGTAGNGTGRMWGTDTDSKAVAPY